MSEATTNRLGVGVLGAGGVRSVQVNKPVCVRVGGGRLTEVNRTAAAPVGAISTNKDPQRASHTRAVHFKSGLPRRICFVP